MDRSASRSVHFRCPSAETAALGVAAETTQANLREAIAEKTDGIIGKPFNPARERRDPASFAQRAKAPARKSRLESALIPGRGCGRSSGATGPLTTIPPGAVRDTCSASDFYVLRPGLPLRSVGRLWRLSLRLPSGAIPSIILMQLTPQHRIAAKFIAAAGVSIAIGALAYWSASRSRDYATSVAHSQEVAGALLSVVVADSDFLTAERGYLITGDDAYLKAYGQTVAKANAALQRAHALTADNPSERPRLAVISTLVEQLEAFTARVLRARTGHGAPRAAALMMNGSEERLQNAIGANVSDLITEERGSIAQRQRRMARASNMALDLILAGSGLAVLIGLIANTLTRRDFLALQQAEERFRALMDSAPDAMVVVDGASRISLVNARTETLFGYNRQELIGKSIKILIPTGYFAGQAPLPDAQAPTPAPRPVGSSVELVARRHDGCEFPVEVTLGPVAMPGGLHIASAIRDISDRKRTLEQLREARAKAERADRAKSTFLATASHDLRQPLQTISLLNGALRRMVRDPDPGRALSQQEAAIGVMSRLLNALLDISKLESGAVRPVLTDWQAFALLDQLRGEFANVAASKGLRLDMEGSSVWVHSDLSLVGQVLRNLLSNAIKYTWQGNVRLRASTEGEEVRIEVSDTGIGMAPQEIGHIYEEFYQIGVPTNATREGYGLGLSIVSRIVKLLNLELDVHSEVGKGSTFVLRLPAGIATVGAQSQPGVRSAAERSARSAHHVLVVDDEPAVLDATRLLLMAEGYRVATASSVAQARERVRVLLDLKLVITDYHLAGGEIGEQVIESVRRVRGSDFKAVLITGDTSTAAKRLRDDENLHFLSKPVDPDQLLGLLKELLSPCIALPEHT